MRVNKASDFVFCDDVQHATGIVLSEKLSQDSIVSYAFARSVHNHKVTKESGSKSVHPCPVMIRLGASVRSNVGQFKARFNSLLQDVEKYHSVKYF